LGPPFLPANGQRMQKEGLVKVVEEWMEGTPFFLVDVQISTDNDVIIAFESSTDDVEIDDCVSLTRFIEEHFDRTVEDYALEVGSAGLGQPFKVLKQFEKHLGQEIEVLPKTGKKETGILQAADEQGFTVELIRKVKTEGSKRPVLTKEHVTYAHTDVKHVAAVVHFS